MSRGRVVRGVSAVAHFFGAAATSLSCWDVQFSSVQSCHASPTRPRSETLNC